MLRGVFSNPVVERIVHEPSTDNHASVRDHVRLILEKLRNRKEQTSTAEEDKKVNQDRARDSRGKAAFAERLKAAIERRGWSLTETARHTASVLGTDAKFGRGNLSHYLHGRAMPRARHLAALSHALGVSPDDLLPGGHPSRVEVLSGTPTGIHALDQGDGTVLLEVSQRVPWQTALEVMRLLKLPYDSSSSEGQWH
jgi:transcriptional regulator with XRE-family HTH domain